LLNIWITTYKLRGLKMRVKPKCFGSNRRDNSLICQKCDFVCECLWELKDKQYNDAQKRILDKINSFKNE
jgi:hypothetical protein